MKKIKILPEELSRKIAAGEVIERPFSVVKELVENSIDARATKIDVELISGGKKLIRVIDDGEGMSKDDAQLAFQRHSTSKISSENDLLRIQTLGFRGEALPSIAAVSRVILKTRTKEDLSGCYLEITGEGEYKISEIAHPTGTSVEVRDLFYNLPVRKKFMKSVQAELSLIIRYLTQLALSHHFLQFSLSHQGRLIFSYLRVNNLRERIFQIYGRSFLDQLFEINFQQEDFQLNGFFSRPPYGRPNKAWQLFFINQRPIKDKILSSALNQAYFPLLEKDVFPAAFLFLNLPYQDVDVNVHPTKAEVRFYQPQKIFNQIYQALIDRLNQETEIKEIWPGQELDREKSFKIMESPPPYQPGELVREKIFWKDLFSPPTAKEEERYPKVLGQYLESYILVEDKEGLLIIDQHNAQERILYEKYKKKIENKDWPVQEALFPILLELTPSQQLSLEEKKNMLETLGFKLEPMGGNTFSLRGFPEILSSSQAENVFLALLEEENSKKLDNLLDSLIATLACKTAIKINHPLTFEKMEYLVDELFKTSNPSFCPHQRPIMVRITQKEIEKSLGRS
ncbi:MAG: DNA mismatch repair endonuclease MutL [Candidatus Aminicenantia bacterium]